MRSGPLTPTLLPSWCVTLAPVPGAVAKPEHLVRDRLASATRCERSASGRCPGRWGHVAHRFA